MSTNTTNTTNPWFGITMLLAGGIVGYGVAIGYDSTGTAELANNPPKDQPKQQQPTANFDALPEFNKKNDYYKGNAKAQIVLIEYSDFQCPYCQRHHATMQQVVNEYEDDVVWVYRHYPLGNHPEAQLAAEATECAGNLEGNEAFWGYADKIFAEGTKSENYLQFALDLGVDEDDFKKCMEEGTFTEKIQKQLSTATEAGVRGTPGTFAVNTDSGEIKYISGAQPIIEIKKIIDSFLN